MVSERIQNAYVPEGVSEEDRGYFEKGGFGARVGWGEKPAVVVVDMLAIFTSDDFALGRGDTSAGAIESTATLLGAAREAGVDVYYTRSPADRAKSLAFRGYFDAKKESEDDSANWDPEAGATIHPDVAPADEDVVIEKAKPSAFFDTHLANLLHYRGVDTVVVCGVSTSGGVRATVVDAISSNFRPIVPRECVADRVLYSHEASLLDIDMKFGDVTTLEAAVERLADYA